MQIAIVDDLAPDRRWLRETLTDYLQQHGLSGVVTPFESGTQFVAALETMQFDIVFLDIYLGDMSGLEAAACLRRHDRDCKLVFTTTSEEFLRQGYGYNACHYLIKPIDESAFAQAMENCRLERQVAVPFWNVVSNGLALRLDTTQIQYIDFSRPNTCIHMTDRVVAISDGFAKTIEPLLCDKRFLLCIKGVLVNMDYISGLDDNVFLLKNGVRLQIALRNKKSIIDCYRSYVFDRMGGF